MNTKLSAHSDREGGQHHRIKVLIFRSGRRRAEIDGGSGGLDFLDFEVRIRGQAFGASVLVLRNFILVVQ